MSSKLDISLPVELVCQICGATAWQPLYGTEDYVTGDRFTIVRCAACGLVCTWPQPADLGVYYPDVYYGKSMRRFPAFVEWMIGLSRRMRAGDIDRIVRARGIPGTPPSIVDVGCGRGLMLSFLQRLGWRCCGTEMSETSAQGARAAGLDVHAGTLTVGLLEPSSFDVVTLYHVLEHLPDPRGTLMECGRLLRPGGVLVIAVPDHGGWQARFGGPVWFHLDPPRHLYHFDRVGLGRLLESTGFRPFRWRFFAPVYDLFGWIHTALNRFGFPTGLLYRLLHVNSKYPSPGPLAAALALLASVPAGIVALPLMLAGLMVKDGSTMEVWSTRDPGPAPGDLPPASR